MSNPEMMEKAETSHLERERSGSQTPPAQERVEYDTKSEKKLIRKIDYRLLPILGALYSMFVIVVSGHHCGSERLIFAVH
jgi:hypothetical protein